MNHIPTRELKHEDESVFFAFRTMEENHKRMESEVSPPHRHDFYTILLVKKACGSHFIDYEEYKMEPQTIFFVSPGQVHQVVVRNDEPSGDIIMFSEEFLSRNYISEEFITNLGMFSCGVNTPPIHLSEESCGKICRLSNEIEMAFEGDSPFKFDIISSHLKLLLIECNYYAVPPYDVNPQSIQSGKPLIKTFRELLNKQVYDWHKVNEYAEVMNISPDYLNNVIKSNIGKTAKEMIADRIILEAKRMGLHTQLSTKEIAYQLGYDDPSHFSKFFKNVSGQSFTDFRANLERMMER